MNESDFQFVESKLDIRLPQEYRKLMCPFPIRSYVGNSDTPLWDDAAGLVELNLRLRSETGWRTSLFAIGDTDGSTTAMDLSTPKLEVWWIYGTIQAPGSGPTRQDFAGWSGELLK